VQRFGGAIKRNYGWAELMKRVFGFDVLKCDRCGGRMRILCAINPPEAIKKILDCLQEPLRPSPKQNRRFGPAASGKPICPAVGIIPSIINSNNDHTTAAGSLRRERSAKFTVI
jgi:hypothetical protein